MLASLKKIRTNGRNTIIHLKSAYNFCSKAVGTSQKKLLLNLVDDHFLE